MGTLFLFGLFIAFFAVCYKLVIDTHPVLNWWFMFGMRFQKYWFYKPIWGCELCFAGQIALWVYLLNWLSSGLDRNALFWRFVYFVIPEIQKGGFNVLNGLIFIFSTIFYTAVISHLYTKLKNEN